MNKARIPAMVITAMVVSGAQSALGAPAATAQDWQGAGTYKLGTAVQDVNIREYPGAVSMGLIGPGTEVVIVNAPASNGYVFARIRSSTNHTTDPSDDYGINVCAYVPFRLADGTQPFYKTSGETGPYDGTCPGVRQTIDGKQRVPAPRYAQSRPSAVTEAGTQSPNDVTDHGQDSYWYSNLAGTNGTAASHGTCPVYRSLDYVHGGLGFPFPPDKNATPDRTMWVRYFTASGQHAMVHLAGAQWGFVSASCITDQRF